MGDDSSKKTDLPELELSEGDLEIELLEEAGKDETGLRKSYRYAVAEIDDCWVIIEGKTYPLYDLSETGIAVSLPSEAAFQIGTCFGDILSGCTINILDTQISGLDYKMIHLSPGTGDVMICGLNWENPDPKTQTQLNSAIKSLKENYFKKYDT